MNPERLTIHFDTVEPVGEVRAKLVMMHGEQGTGRLLRKNAGIDSWANSLGVRIYFPTAFGHDWHARDLQHAQGQFGRLNRMLNQTPALPVVWSGYSDGGDMAQLCVVLSELANDPNLCGGLFYGSRLHADPPKGKCPILLAHNIDDNYATAEIVAGTAKVWSMAGNPASIIVGKGNHLALWDQDQNPLFETWMHNAIEDFYNPVPV